MVNSGLSSRAFLLAIAISSSAAIARPVEDWTYEKLWNDARLVCIARITSSKVVPNDDFKPEYLERIESKLKIELVMKGERETTEIVVVHYRYKKGVNAIGNGPSFAFGDSEMRFGEKGEDEKARFLLFLSPIAGGRYKPVSGDLDAGYSVSPVQGTAFRRGN